MSYRKGSGLGTGTRLGRYEIVGFLDGGGMGEIYRARDTRLNRDVAIKVLRPNAPLSSDAVSRFEQEARITGALNHPNILVIYDVGTYEDAPYIVSELLAGETLKKRLGSGPLPVRTAIAYAAQIAAGLGAAHEKGIVHRDLKPANIFLTNVSGLKILDFGLAKLLPETTPKLTDVEAETVSIHTRSERIEGTPSYMSPEQVRGEPIDHRSDIFSFGAVFYEMLTGQRAFLGASDDETMRMVERHEPPSVEEWVAGELSPAVSNIVRRCLEKARQGRFDSARDLGFSVAAIGESLSSAPRRVRKTTSRRDLVLAGAAALSAAAGGVLLGRATVSRMPRFRRLTYRRGTVYGARFMPQGDTVVYAAAWQGAPPAIYSVRPERPESALIGHSGANLLAVSPTGELALALGYHYLAGFIFAGVLARVPLSGGAPREVAREVEWADWAPDGSDLAIVRQVGGKSRLEYPLGRVLYETGGWIGEIRFSPDGRQIAFVEHPAQGDNGGFAASVDRAGTKKVLSPFCEALEGLSWAAGNSQPWFTAARVGANLNLCAAGSGEHMQELAGMAGWSTLADCGRNGRALICQGSQRFELFAFGPSQDAERNLSWYDWSLARDISNDGRLVLFDESGEGGGAGLGVYIGNTDGSPPIRLGDGVAMSLSPDAQWALAFPTNTRTAVVLMPTRAGESKTLALPEGFGATAAEWYPDGKRILLAATERGRGVRLYEMQLGADMSATAPRPFTPEGQNRSWRAISPDGQFVISSDIEGRSSVYRTADGEARPAPGMTEDDLPIRWSEDPRYFFAQSRSQFPTRLYRIEFATGRREIWKEISPRDPTGVRALSSFRISPNGKWYAYSLETVLTDLYLAEGLG